MGKWVNGWMGAVGIAARCMFKYVQKNPPGGTRGIKEIGVVSDKLSSMVNQSTENRVESPI